MMGSGEIEKKMILKKIGETTNLPAPSDHVMKVMVLLRDENVNMNELIDAISKDQSLVAQILKLINSGYYGLRKEIETVDHAVNLLGILNVKQVVYSASVMEMFSKKEQIEWNHSYSSSMLMNKIMRENDVPAASNLAMTTLMHDIGKVVLRRYSPKKYQLAMDAAVSRNIGVHFGEEEFFQTNHAEVGGWLLEKWDMTEDIVYPVMQHHCVDVPEQYILETALVQFVNYVDCAARGMICEPPSQVLLAAAGFEDLDLDEWIAIQKEMVAELDGAVELTGADDATQKIQRIKPTPSADPGNVDASTKMLANFATVGIPSTPTGDSQPHDID